MTTEELLKHLEDVPPADKEIIEAVAMKMLELSEFDLEALRKELEKQLEDKQ